MITGFRRPMPVGDEAEQRAADDPAERHRRRAHHRGCVVESVRLLQIADAPDHVEDRRRNEQQSRDHAAQDRLRIPKDDTHGGRRFTKPSALFVLCFPVLILGKEHEEQSTNCQPDDAHADPETVPGQAAGDHRPDDELAGRAAGHAEHLCRADQRGGARGRKVRRGDVDGADQREDAAGALQEPADACATAGCPSRTAARRLRPSAAPTGITRFGSQPVHRSARDQAERRIAVVEKADQRGSPERIRPKASDICGIMTAGAERSEYW